MPGFLRPATTWVVDFRFDGRPRRWFRVFGPEVDVRATMARELAELHDGRAWLVDVRRATDTEETQYLRDELPRTAYCPTGRSVAHESVSGSSADHTRKR